MVQIRDTSLPDGMSDLLDKVLYDEDIGVRKDLAAQKQISRLFSVAGELRFLARLLGSVCQRVDRDLLFADDFELAEPKVREVIREEWGKIFRKPDVVSCAQTRDAVVALSLKLVKNQRRS